MQLRLLFINCYKSNSEEKAEAYIQAFHEAARALGVELSLIVRSDTRIRPDHNGWDAVVVSGSQKMVGQNEYEPDMVSFLLGNKKPLLGICYGHQILARAFGCLVHDIGRTIEGDQEIRLRQSNHLTSGLPQRFPMRESHREAVARNARLGDHFFVLAENDENGVEAIRHRELPFYGVQFHPEKSGTAGIDLIANFLRLSLKKP